MNLKTIYLILILFISNIKLGFAQEIFPLIKTNKHETIHFASKLEDEILALHHFDSIYRVSTLLEYDSLIIALPKVNAVFSSLKIYDHNLHPIQQLDFTSTKDSIFIYQNFLITEPNPATQLKEIVLFGTLLTPSVITRTALWLDLDFNINHRVIYDPNLFFDIKNGGVSSHFILNNKGNIVTNIKGSTVELNKKGELVKKAEYQLGKNYFQNDQLDYLSPFKNGISISNSELVFVQFETNEWQTLYPINFKYVNNRIDKYLLYHATTGNYFQDCEGSGIYRNAIVKYDTETYEAETYFSDSFSNCHKDLYIPDFSIDYFYNGYVYIIHKYYDCGFINLDIDGINICNTEFMEVQCIDKNGELRWRKELGGDASYWPRGIVATPDSGCVVFTNRYERGINIGYESDLYYTKLNKHGKIVQPIPVSVAEPNSTNQESQTFVYPNPVHDVLFVNHTIQNSTKNVWIEIYDLQGQLVLSQKVKDATISTAQLTNGIYSYTVKQDGQILKSDKLLKF